jgi:hypothetical protein
MMRDRHNIPEGTKDLSAKYKRNVEKHKHCSICLSSEELAKKRIVENFVPACQYGQRVSKIYSALMPYKMPT